MRVLGQDCWLLVLEPVIQAGEVVHLHDYCELCTFERLYCAGFQLIALHIHLEEVYPVELKAVQRVDGAPLRSLRLALRWPRLGKDWLRLRNILGCTQSTETYHFPDSV